MGATLQSAALTLLSFALVISVVVFFHELGHLIVGKLVGVKAVRFSIGFGPKLWSFQKGETEYRVAVLPLGGYVKFAGDNPYEELAAEDQGRGFLEQPAWKKGVIAAAGPVANFVLAVVLFFFVFAAPRPDMRAKVGYVKPGSPADKAGLQYADEVTAIDGTPIDGWTAMQQEIRAHGGETLWMHVSRHGQPLELQIVPILHEETNPIETVKHGRIGVAAVPRAAEVTVVSPDSPAGRAGIRTFDKVVRMNGQPVPNWEDLAEKLSAEGGAVTLDLLRPREVPAPGAMLWAEDPLTVQLPAPASRGDYGLEPSDLTLFTVQPGSAAAEAGLRRGDKILTVAGMPARMWTDEVDAQLKAAGTEPVPFVVRRDGKQISLSVVQHLRKDHDETGVLVDVPDFGASPDMNGYVEPERISVRYSLPQAASHAVLGLKESLRTQTLMIARMFTGKVSSRSIGGPLMLADVARRAVEQGWRDLLLNLSLISIALGFMNLLPVPVLDGFHVLSAFIEGIRRRPLSLRFREVANVVGLALLFTLMLYAFRNDAMRKWFE